MRKQIANLARTIASQRYLLNPRFLILIAVMINFQACGTAQPLEEVIKRLNVNQEYKLGVIDNSLSNNRMCVLSPYQDRVSSEFSDSDLLNKKLEEIKFELTESATLIFFDANLQPRIEPLRGLYLRTLNNATPTTDMVHQCGAVEDFHIHKFAASTVAIFKK